MFDQRIADEGIPTIVNMVNALDGYEEDGVVAARRPRSVVLDDGTVRRDTIATVRFAKLGARRPAVPHRRQPGGGLPAAARSAWPCSSSSSSPPASASPAWSAPACLVLACTGLAALPARGWAVGLIVAAMLAFAVDVQVGVPRFWTGVGIVAARSSAACGCSSRCPASTLRPSWITLLAGIGGIVLAFVVGMPSMVRTRFATPTIGREWMIGELGEVVDAVDPDGVVSVGDGTLAGAHQPGDAGRRRRAGARRRHRRRHAGGRAARGRRPRPPRTAPIARRRIHERRLTECSHAVNPV